jgi:hypothetical protein
MMCNLGLVSVVPSIIFFRMTPQRLSKYLFDGSAESTQFQRGSDDQVLPFKFKLVFFKPTHFYQILHYSF